MDTSISKENGMGGMGGDLSLSGEWTVFGVYPPSNKKIEEERLAGIRSWSPYRNGVNPDAIPAPEEMTAIPDHLELDGVRRAPRTIRVSKGMLDMRTVLGPMNEWDMAYVYIPVTLQEPQQVTLGFGAYYWMQVWINGRQILSTMKNGNHYLCVSMEDFQVDVKLDKGMNMIVIRYVSCEVIEYSNDENAVIGNEWRQGLALAAGGPVELRELARARESRYKLAWEGRDRIGPGVTKSTYIKNDGVHAWYTQRTGGYHTSVRGSRLLEDVEGSFAYWKTDADGNRILDFNSEYLQTRISEDNGRTWKNYGGKIGLASLFGDGNPREQTWGMGFLLDVRNDLLVRLSAGAHGMFYAISRDQGMTWGELQKCEFQEVSCDGNCVWMDDGSLVFSGTTCPRGGGYWEVKCIRGYWRKDMSGFDWVVGEPFIVPPEKSKGGCCEPTIANMGGENLFVVTRCEGDPARGIYAQRYSGFSQDGGMTWSEPEPLKYDDGSIVWSPASFTRFFVSSKTGKTYWLANIIDRPVFTQEPRFPLTIAEFDLEKRCIIKSSVRIIQDMPENANEHVRYTNFAHYEDRETGNLVIMLPEEFRYLGTDEFRRLEDHPADYVKYIVELT